MGHCTEEQSNADIDCLDVMGASLTSLRDLRWPKDSAALNLHLNRLTKLEGLASTRFAQLRELVVSGNHLRELHQEDFTNLPHLVLLDLSCNELQKLHGLAPLVSLERLLLAFNRLASLDGLQQLWGLNSRLQELDLRCNRVSETSQFIFLSGCFQLRHLKLSTGVQQQALQSSPNPVVSLPGWRQWVSEAAPWLKEIDGAPAGLGKEQTSHIAALRPCPHLEMAGSLEKQVQEEAVALKASAAEAMVATAKTRALREAAQSARQGFEKVLLAERNHEEALQQEAELRLRTDLAEIATEVHKREEQHAVTLQRLQAAEAALQDAAGSRRAEARVLVELTDEANSAAAEQQASKEAVRLAEQGAQGLQAELKTVKEASTHHSILEDPAREVQQELSRVRRTLVEVRSQAHKSRDGICWLSEKVKAAETLTEQETEAEAQARQDLLLSEGEAADAGHLAAEAAGRTANLHAEVAAKERQRLCALLATVEVVAEHSKAEHKAQSAVEDSEKWSSEVHSAWALPLSSDTQPGPLGDIMALRKLQLTLEKEAAKFAEETRRSKQSHSALEDRLREAQQAAESHVAGSQQRASELEHQLLNQSGAAEVAAEQDRIGRQLVEEFTQELRKARQTEETEHHKAWEISEKTAATASWAKGSGEEIAHLRDQLQALTEELQCAEVLVARSPETAAISRLVPRWVLEQRQASVRAGSSALETLRRCRGDLRAALGSSSTPPEQAAGGEAQLPVRWALSQRRAQLQSLRTLLHSYNLQGAEVEQQLRIKEQMQAHAKAQRDQLKDASKLLESQKQELGAQRHKKLQELSATAEARRGFAEEIDEEIKRRLAEEDRRARAALQKSEAASFGAQQLAGLLNLCEELRLRAKEQVTGLQDEGMEVLAGARQAASCMEHQFREDMAALLAEKSLLSHELHAASEELQAAPGAVKAVAARIAEERASSARRAAVLLAGLRAL